MLASYPVLVGDVRHVEHLLEAVVCWYWCRILVCASHAVFCASDFIHFVFSFSVVDRVEFRPVAHEIGDAPATDEENHLIREAFFYRILARLELVMP